MTKQTIIKLKPGEYIRAVIPKKAAGPGWANSPAWVIIYNNIDGTYREECIQPEERSAALHYLFNIGFETQTALVSAIPTKRVSK